MIKLHGDEVIPETEQELHEGALQRDPLNRRFKNGLTKQQTRWAARERRNEAE